MTDFDESLQRAMRDGKLPCEAGHRAARETGHAPGEAGAWADETGIRVSHCQLGLFGYGPKAEGKHKIVRPAESVSPALLQAIQSRAEEGLITCAALWDVADTMGISRLDASGAAEALRVRVIECQLGCF